GDDVWVLEPGDGPDLALKPLEQQGAMLLRRVEHLDGHLPAQQDVLRPVDNPHAARAETVEDTVVAQEQAEGVAAFDARTLIRGQEAVLLQEGELALRVRSPLE